MLLAFRVTLKNKVGDTFQIRVECYRENDCYQTALDKVSEDPMHVKYGPWEPIHSIRCY